MLRNLGIPKLRSKAGLAVGVAAVVIAAVVIPLGSGGGGPGAPAPAPPAPAPPAPAAEQFGANVGRLFNDRTYDAAQIDQQLAALRATGATVARADALWEAAEPSAPTGRVHRYDWSFDDAIAGALAAHGLRWLPIVDYTAPWAQSIPGDDHSPPAFPGGYAAYAGALATRYGPGGAFWRAHPGLPQLPVDSYEIWNEPDNPAFWSRGPNAAAYADLYIEARAAIASAQPGARVLVGGLTHPESFLPAMLAAVPSLAGQLDGVAIHPYGLDPQAVLAGVSAARRTLDAAGLARVPLYVTEFGWTTDPPGALDYLPEALRPRYIELTLERLGHLDCGVAAALLYAWVTPERDPRQPQDWYGINPPAGGGSPDVAAFAAGLEAAAAPAPVSGLCPGAT